MHELPRRLQRAQAVREVQHGPDAVANCREPPAQLHAVVFGDVLLDVVRMEHGAPLPQVRRPGRVRGGEGGERLHPRRHQGAQLARARRRRVIGRAASENRLCAVTAGAHLRAHMQRSGFGLGAFSLLVLMDADDCAQRTADEMEAMAALFGDGECSLSVDPAVVREVRPWLAGDPAGRPHSTGGCLALQTGDRTDVAVFLSLHPEHGAWAGPVPLVFARA